MFGVWFYMTILIKKNNYSVSPKLGLEIDIKKI